ncbi:MAG TPA: DNA polymerase III subunit beta, partial [Chlamydiales bacterium]|nr:DNA polymerase III subunit beta [Chlamydiales bacterium]
MKFIIGRQELSEIVSRTQNIIVQKMPLPILSNFLIEAKDNRVIITATDLTIGISVQHPAKVIEEGATTIPAKRFAALVRELTSSHVEVSSDEKETIHIHAEASNFKVPGLAKGDYPALPET